MKGSLAATTSNLHVGDKILKINGASTSGWSLEKVVHTLRSAGETIVFLVATKKRRSVAPTTARATAPVLDPVSSPPKDQTTIDNLAPEPAAAPQSS